MKGVAGTCHYCEKASVQSVVWLKDKRGRAARIVLPHCGCDLYEALKRFWPEPGAIFDGIDYMIEPLTAGAVPAKHS